MLRKRFAWLLVLSLASAPAFAGRVDLLSKKETPGPAHAVGEVESLDAMNISGDGRFVVFGSTSPNLVPGQSDGNNALDLFLWDRNTGEVRLVSHLAGSPATAVAYGISPSSQPQISADGRWIAFCSRGTGLIPEQQPVAGFSLQVYLYDRLAGSAVLVSRSAASPTRGAQGYSCGLALSSDGRYLAFDSDAGDLVSPAVTGNNVYLYDRVAGTLTLVSHAAGNPAQAADGPSISPSISADGRWIGFASSATDLAAEVIDGNGQRDVFLFDRTTGTNVLVSHAAGVPASVADSASEAPAISANGEWIAFLSTAWNLVAGQSDSSFTLDVFLWERATGTTRLVSHANGSATTSGNGDSDVGTFSRPFAISADGARVVYQSWATDLAAGTTDGNESRDVYLFDRSTGANVLVSHAAGAPGQAAAGDSTFPTLSADGSHVFFSSQAADLVPGGSNPDSETHQFAWDRATSTATLVSHAHGSPAEGGNRLSQLAVPAHDGLSIAFRSYATDLTAAADTNDGADLFHHDLATGATTRVSASPPLASIAPFELSETLDRQAVSADGRFVVFRSFATDLVPGQTGGPTIQRNVFLADRTTGLVTLVSHSVSSPVTAGNESSQEAVISRDGRFIAFTSWATDLIPGQTGGGLNAFLFDRTTGSTLLMSRAPGSSTQGGGLCGFLSISDTGRYVAFLNDSRLHLFDREAETLTPIHPGVQAFTLLLSGDGRYLAFYSSATNLVPGQIDANFGGDVFLYDRVTGTTTLASRSASSPVTTGNQAVHFLADVSPDGRFVLFTGAATDHVTGQVDGNGTRDLFLFDRTAGTVALVSHATGSPAMSGNRGSEYGGALSRDGRFVAFTTAADNLVPGQSPSAALKVCLYDRLSGAVSLVSHRSGSLTASADFSLSWMIPAISGDGSRVAFVTDSRDELIPGVTDTNEREDVYLYDRHSGSLELVSHRLGAPGAAGYGMARLRPALSEDGRVVAFTSGAGDLAADDNNITDDVFAFAPEEQDFHTLTPCRLFDSREDGPALPSGLATVVEAAGACGIPATARALAVNVTVIQPGSAGYLTLYPGDGLPPLASTLTFGLDQTRTNNTTVRLAPSGGGTLAIRPVLAGGGGVDVAVDVVGFFE